MSTFSVILTSVKNGRTDFQDWSFMPFASFLCKLKFMPSGTYGDGWDLTKPYRWKIGILKGQWFHIQKVRWKLKYERQKKKLRLNENWNMKDRKRNWGSLMILSFIFSFLYETIVHWAFPFFMHNTLSTGAVNTSFWRKVSIPVTQSHFFARSNLNGVRYVICFKSSSPKWQPLSQPSLFPKFQPSPTGQKWQQAWVTSTNEKACGVFMSIIINCLESRLALRLKGWKKTPKILENLKIRWRPLFFLDFLVKTDNRPEWQVQRKSMRACLCQSLSIVWKICFLEVFLTYYVTYLYQLPRFEKWKRLGSSIVNSKPDKSDNRPEWQVQTERHARVFMSIIINCLESLLSMGFQSDGYVFESGLNSVTLKVQPSKA